MAVQPIETGEGKNGPWKKRLFVIEYPDGNFQKTLALTAWNDKADTLLEHMTGREVTVSFNAESREYNGRWYTDLKAWRIEQSDDSAESSAPVGEPGEQGNDGQLPF